MSQLQTATPRHHLHPVDPLDPSGQAASDRSTAPTVRAAAAGSPSAHALWWERLPPDERRHTRACVEADDVDAWMLDIFRRSGPVGPYGVRWVRDAATFLPGSFVDFVRGAPSDAVGC